MSSISSFDSGRRLLPNVGLDCGVDDDDDDEAAAAATGDDDGEGIKGRRVVRW